MSSFVSKSSDSTRDTVLTDIQTLIDDVKNIGGFVNEDIEFVISNENNDKGICIFSKKSISPGILLVKVPYGLCLSYDMINCDPYLSKVLKENEYLQSMPDEVLTLAIMYAASNTKNQCEWFNHVRMFPKALNSTLFWSQDELNELKSCNIYYLTHLMNKRMESDWQQIQEPLIHQYPTLFSGHTFELYRWAISMVYSRSIGIYRNKQYNRCIPILIDMANHSFSVGRDSSDTFEFNEEGNSIAFYNTVTLNEHSECFASYGSYSNSKLAYTYGFVLLNNPVHAIDLWTKVSATTTFSNLKQIVLDKNNLTNNQTYDFTGTIRNNYISTALLTTIRVIQLDDKEIQITDEKILNNPKKMVSVRNEKATYVALKSLIIAKMKSFSPESDENELKISLENKLPFNNRKMMALIIRTDEYKLYQETLLWIDTLMCELESLGEDYIPPDCLLKTT